MKSIDNAKIQIILLIIVLISLFYTCYAAYKKRFAGKIAALKGKASPYVVEWTGSAAQTSSKLFDSAWNFELTGAYIKGGLAPEPNAVLLATTLRTETNSVIWVKKDDVVIF